MNNWYSKEFNKILEELNSSELGLSSEEVDTRLKKFGPNKLPEAKVDSTTTIFLRQFQSPLIYILLLATLIVFAMGEIIDGLVILFVLIFNAVVGTIQEGKAQNTLFALKKFTETKSTVLRDGQETIISSSLLVPGDILIIEEGEKIGADARVFLSHNLKVDESSLTGESEPVHKTSDVLKEKELPLMEQKNMVFKGTFAVSGNGKAIVVRTGTETIIGKIAKEIERVDADVPLKKDIKNLSKIIIFITLLINIFLLAIGIITGKSLRELFTTIVSLSVSVIPEGLPVVITLVLAKGVWDMSKKKALVKKLQAVEALGQTHILAVDKTGTITKNEMIVQKAYVDGEIFDVGGIGYAPKGEIKLKDKIIEPLNHTSLLLLGKITSLSANAHIMFLEKEKKWKISGDPTEAALLVFGKKVGFNKADLELENPLIGELPFNYKTKYRATLHKDKDRNIITVSGAPEKILELCNEVWSINGNSILTEEKKREIETILRSLSQEGLRVIGLAMKEEKLQTITRENINSLTFVGFLGMKDTLREETKDIVKKAGLAGIRVVMITGDHKITAQAIAKEAQIYKDGDLILTGEEIDKMSDKELAEKVLQASVFARVTPEHKLKIIQAYKSRGKIVAMTGDGVNDAPSLVAADLGVAMGKIGTEVSKEAADIVLLNDNLESIIFAVEEGRNIYKTIKKVILYLFSTSLGEVLTITSAILLGLPIPLLATQIIWLNFVTDGFLTVAVATEPKEKDLLKQGSKKPSKYFIDKSDFIRMLIMAISMALGTLLLFNQYYENDIQKAITVSLTTLAVFQWFNAWNVRHDTKSIFQLNPLSNIFLFWATIIVIILQVLAIYNPFMQKILQTSTLNLDDWLKILSVAISIIILEEMRKILSKKIKNYKIFTTL